jgi:uncharacterized protein (TIGR04255 family)
MRAPVKFDKPPVVEVACGVLFVSPGPISTAHIGAFWNRVKSSFPRVEDAPPLSQIVEQAGQLVTEFEWSELPPMRRTWMLSANGSSLIQIQQDRFLFNWKRTLDQDVYPSYDSVIADFERYFSEFMTFLEETGVSRPTCRQYDLTYINFVPASLGLDKVGPTKILVDHRRAQVANRFLPEPEAFNWTSSYSLPEGMGRLHVSAQSAISHTTAERAVRLDMVARGMPKEDSAQAMRKWFDLAHEWITQGFADSTSEELQTDFWKRTHE